MSAQGQLRDRTKQFAFRIIRLFKSLPRSTEALVIGKQLLRSGTSVAANYRAVNRARSRAEFIAKIGVVLEEVDEAAGVVKPALLEPLLKEANELVAIFAASHRTARSASSPPK